MTISSNNLKVQPMLAKSCLLCQLPNEKAALLCQACLSYFEPIKRYCPQCRNRTPVKALCPTCLANPPHFNQLICYYYYNQPLQWLLQQFKYHQSLYLSHILSNLLLKPLQQDKIKLPQCLIPVPLHRKRMQQRGYNQANEIAKILASNLNVNLDNTSAKRLINTPAQASLEQAKRHTNVKKAFACNLLNYNHIAIVDDIVTTGSTVNSLCQAIKQTNPDIKIDIWCLARTLL